MWDGSSAGRRLVGPNAPCVESAPVEVHLAQFNTATLRRPLDHPESATYVALLDEVNALAEASPGFVWRHGIDSRDSSSSVYPDPLTLVNMSVWETAGQLRDYAYKGFHRDVFRRRQEWFDRSDAVMWWIPAGTLPTLDEGVRRLDFLHRHGATPYGFETGQQHRQLVIAPRPHDDGEVISLTGGAAADADVHLAVLAGRPVAAAQTVDGRTSVWLGQGEAHAWLEPALLDHLRRDASTA